MSDAEAEKQRKKRSHAVKEIVESEEVYLQHLRLLIDLYMTPIRSKDIIKPTSDVGIVFNNIEQILSIHTRWFAKIKSELLKFEDAADMNFSWLIQELINSGVSEKIAVGDLEVKSFQEEYYNYVGNHGLAVELLTRIKNRNPKFRAICKEASEATFAEGLDLEDLLITPVQRIPRLKLLLVTLQKYTPDSIPDYYDLPPTIANLDSIAKQLDKSALVAEDMSVVVKISKNFDKGDKIGLAVSGRKLVKVGVLKKKNTRFSADKKFTFFLFNDALAYAHGGGTGPLTRYVLHHIIPIDEKFQAKDVPPNKIEIISSVRQLLLFAEGELKTEWINALKKTIEDAAPYLAEQAAKRAAKESVSVATDKPMMKKPMEKKEVDGDEVFGELRECSLCKQPFTFLQTEESCDSCGMSVCKVCDRFTFQTDAGTTGHQCEKCFMMKSMGPMPGKPAMAGVPGKSMPPIPSASKGEAERDTRDSVATFVSTSTYAETDESAPTLFHVYLAAYAVASDPVNGVLGMDVSDELLVLYEHPTEGYLYVLNRRSQEYGWIHPYSAGAYLGVSSIDGAVEGSDPSASFYSESVYSTDPSARTVDVGAYSDYTLPVSSTIGSLAGTGIPAVAAPAGPSTMGVEASYSSLSPVSADETSTEEVHSKRPVSGFALPGLAVGASLASVKLSHVETSTAAQSRASAPVLESVAPPLKPSTSAPSFVPSVKTSVVKKDIVERREKARRESATVKVKSPVPALTSDTTTEKMYAKRGFTGDETELSMAIGDEVEILEKDLSGFWFARNSRTKEEGWVDPGYLGKTRLV